jgi:hypothetical protein
MACGNDSSERACSMACGNDAGCVRFAKPTTKAYKQWGESRKVVFDKEAHKRWEIDRYTNAQQFGDADETLYAHNKRLSCPIVRYRTISGGSFIRSRGTSFGV